MMRKFFKHRVDEVVGIYYADAMIYAVDIRLQESVADVSRIVENDEIVDVEYVFEVDRVVENWTLIDVLEIPFEDIIDEEELKLRAEKLAEKVSALCSTRCWSTDATALCLNASDVAVSFDDFSNIPSTETANAVRYRIATVGNFDIDDFNAAYVDLDGSTWAEGIAKSDAKIWVDAWRRNEMSLTALTAMPDGIYEIEGIDPNGIEINSGLARAIYAARSAALQCAPNFLSEELKRSTGWDFRKFAAAIAAITLIGLTALIGADQWNYKGASTALTLERAQLKSLERDGRMKNFIEDERKELLERRELLAALSKEIFPWRSVLIHFGVFHVKGVWLNELKSADDKSIELKCEALSYEAMSEFIAALEADREFFRHEPEIKSSQAKRNGSTVEFTVRLPML